MKFIKTLIVVAALTPSMALAQNAPPPGPAPTNLLPLGIVLFSGLILSTAPTNGTR